MSLHKTFYYHSNQSVPRIIEASDKPLSIIIIGIGSADFSDMHYLDSDDRLLEQDGKVAKVY